MSVVAIVQARTGSTRLPGKVLADIEGRPMLVRVLERASRARLVDRIVVATTDRPADDDVEALCAAEGVACHRGSADDVLDRYAQAARRFGADTVVRLTGDCPLLDPAVVDLVVAALRDSGADYATNTLPPTFPDGLDVEAFTRAALERAWREAELPAEREHVTPYLRGGDFTVVNVESGDPEAGRLRLAVDDPGDLERVRDLYRRLPADGGWEEALRLGTGRNGAVRNEGYYRSLAAEPPVPPVERSLARSQALKTRAAELIPGASQTFSKGPTQFVQGVAPAFLERGKGCRVWDVDGNEYVDLAMGLAPVVLGHDHEPVREAVERALRDGTALTLPHRLAVEVAERLVELIPCAEQVRFGKNGSDATTAAVRVARAFTGRDVVAVCGYHGWHDWYVGSTTRALGVPDAVRALTVTFAYNDLASLERVLGERPVAAVVMEPVGVVAPEPGFLEGVRERTERAGAVLVFDEIVTGFRLALGGAQEHFGVVPDLAAVGKALANGFPLSAVVGRRDVMGLFEEVFFSGTFGGETASLAAAAATLDELRTRSVIPHLWAQGERLRDGYNVLAAAFGVAERTRAVGLPPRTVVEFTGEDGADSPALRSLFQQECLKRGVLFTGAHNLCLAHTEAEVDGVLRVYRTALELLADALAADEVEARLEGPPVEPVFRRP